KLIEKCKANKTKLIITDLQFQPIRTLARAKIQPIEGVLKFYTTLREALSGASPETGSEAPVITGQTEITTDKQIL
ncbi:MAG: hypothetical protein ACRCWP_05610, partial [Shewanella sp.]